MSILLILSLSAVIITLLFARRNDKVYEELKRVLTRVHILTNKDIIFGKDWKWRYDEIDTIPYNKMLREFWKPVHSYFADSKCCQDNYTTKKKG